MADTYTQGGITYETKSGRAIDPATRQYLLDVESDKNRVGVKYSVKSSAERTRKRKLLTYPLDMKTKTTDYLEISVINYTRPSGLTSRPGSRQTVETENLTDNRKKSILRTIQLPIPSNVQDGNSVSYEDGNLGGITAAAAGGVEKLMNLDLSKMNPSTADGRSYMEQQLTSIIGGTIRDGGGLNVAKDLVNKMLISQAVGIFGGNVTPSQLLAREQGVIFNPNMELLFNGPTLRQFRFSFKMTPREKPEAEMVRQIIREFKQSMAPKVTPEGGGNIFLRTPNVFELRYKTGTSSHDFLHRFKQCALTDMSVNYTGEGTYATYGDRTPISMIMDLTFKELEPVYDIDYDNVRGVGY
jgi:hypothetical protein